MKKEGFCPQVYSKWLSVFGSQWEFGFAVAVEVFEWLASITKNPKRKFKIGLWIAGTALDKRYAYVNH